MMRRRNLHLPILAAASLSFECRAYIVSPCLWNQLASGYSNGDQRYSLITRQTRFFVSLSSQDDAVHVQEDTPLFTWSARTNGWRPTKSDVIAISWGKPARQKGTGSRGVPHRLNAEERFAFDQARFKGYLECFGSGYRSTRRDSPLINSWRSFCDANACVCLILHKNGNAVQGDEIVLDLSPLRLDESFESLGKDVSAWMGRSNDGHYSSNKEVDLLEVQEVSHDDETFVKPHHKEMNDSDWILEDKDIELEMGVDVDSAKDTTVASSNVVESPWETKPIYQLPAYLIQYTGLNRSKAKEICAVLASVFQTMDSNSSRPSKKPTHLKPGKSRKSGGYGI